MHGLNSAPPPFINPQGFNWESWKHGWFQHIEGQAQEIADLGFTTIWLPPFTGERAGRARVGGEWDCSCLPHGSAGGMVASGAWGALLLVPCAAMPATLYP